MRLACDNIEATKATQVRVKLQKEVIDAYREDIEAGAIMPPVDVFAEKGSERYILADGFHRHFATIHAGNEEIEVELHEGGMLEALIYALGANASHGLRRTNADKKNAVKMALKNPEISEMTQQEIADICRVDRRTVGRIARRDRLDENDQNGNNGTMSHEPEENTPENNRPTKTPPTQAEVERDELRQALSLIKALPYDGEDTAKLSLSRDDVFDLEYVSEWCAQAVLANPNDESHDQLKGH